MEKGTHESSERKVTSLPEVMESNSPSCDFSMLVMGEENVMECVGCSVLRSHHLHPHQLPLPAAEQPETRTSQPYPPPY